jgi:hypothetical protein
LTPEKEVGISHDGRGTRSGASIRDGLGWRWSCTIQEAIRIIGFNKGQNLSSLARKVVVGQLDIQGMVHIWDGEENVG